MKNRSGNSFVWLFIASVMIIPAVFFLVVSWYENNLQSLPVLSISSTSNVPFSLSNQNGNTITNDHLVGKIVVVDFFFTHCPGICPKMTRNLKMVKDAIKDDPILLINSFSIDPERDSVKRLADYASRFRVEGQWNLLTGDKAVIYRVARKSFKVDASEGDGGPEDFIHSDKFVLVDPSGRIRGYYNGTDQNQVDQLIKDIFRLKSEKSTKKQMTNTK